MSGGYVVAEINQASHQVETVHGPYWTFKEAEDSAEEMRAETAKVGRRESYYVAELEALEDPR